MDVVFQLIKIGIGLNLGVHEDQREAGVTEPIHVPGPTLAPATADGPSGMEPQGISADGRYVLFGSSATNLAPIGIGRM